MSDDVTRLADLMHSLWCLSSQNGVGCDRTAHRGFKVKFAEEIGIPAEDATDAYMAVAQELLASEWLAERDATNRLFGAVQAQSDAIDAHAELVARMEALAGEFGCACLLDHRPCWGCRLRAALNDPTEETTP